ncbi:membrane protein [Streptomyces hygroscopicus]|uniref:TIGR03943 family putative permease subunit n=1 Tax=Streptomyces hygroscopicus TaxID=1912 RepID=UPI00223EC04C|nr:TIGR03943 family protein [Streptomyces hygroscopicus]MCW7942636.1 membrane protein [Streptomyces hygroscopicus]
MKRPAQVLLLVVSGLGLLHASLFTDLCLRYVRPGLRPYLIASGVLLLLLGLAGAALDRREPHEGGHGSGGPEGSARGHDGAQAHADGLGGQGTHADALVGAEPRTEGLRGTDVRVPGQEGPAGHAPGRDGFEGHAPGRDGFEGLAPGSAGHAPGHDHSGAPRIAWLLFLPALSLLFYAPPALGAYTASREAPKAVKEQKRFDPLPATSPVPMTLTDFTTRVQQDRGQAIKARSIQMTGFVTPAQGGDWYLTRIIFTCCAADAQSVKVRVYGAPSLPSNTWVSVTGTWHPGGLLGTRSAPVALDAHDVHRITQPVNAYTDALPLTPSR